MKLSAIVDFYMLERLYYECNFTDVPFDDGETYNVKRESIRSRINTEYNRLAGELSEAFRDYLWLAAFGESRHAWDKVYDCKISPDIPRNDRQSNYREGSMQRAVGFFPENDQNHRLLRAVFADCEWSSSGFGGKAWGKIVEACKLYENWPHSVFVDYVVDLQHNSGTVLNKHGAESYIDLQFSDDHSFWYSMGEFLNLKKDTENIVFDIPIHMGIYVSRIVRNLIREWYPLSPAWMHSTSATIESHSYHPPAWGDKVLSDQLVSSNSHPVRVVQHTSRERRERRERRLEDGQIHCNLCGRVQWSDQCHWDDKMGLHCDSCHDRLFANCEECGRDCHKSRMHDTGGTFEYHWVCQSCYDEKYTTCYHCDETIPSDDSWYSEVTEDTYCEDCYHELFAPCTACDKEFLRDDLHSTDDGLYCDDCYHELFASCTTCDKEFLRDDLHSTDDGFYCDDC